MTLYLPTDTAWETEDPAAEGWNAAALREVVEFARSSHSSAFLMIQNGRILTENYWAPTMHDLPEPVQRGYGNMRRDTLASGQPVEDVASLQAGGVKKRSSTWIFSKNSSSPASHTTPRTVCCGG